MKEFTKILRSKFFSGSMILVSILIFALVLRVYGINWDSNQHLNPDERFLTMVATSSILPESFFQYLDPKTSTLNPYNLGDFKFFVYGTLPLTLTKIAAVTYDMDSYNGIVLAGRFLSAMMDIGTLMWVFLIARLFEKRCNVNDSFKYVAAFMYAIAVLPIQYAHFFTTDSFSVFFSLGAVFWALRYAFLKKKIYGHAVLTGLFMGLALGTKISSVYISPLITVLFLIPMWDDRKVFIKHFKRSVHLLGAGLLGALVTYVTLRIADPRMFESTFILNPSLNPQFLSNIEELKNIMMPSVGFPPGVQWLHAPSIIFPFYNIVFFGLGIPFFIASSIGVILVLLRKNIVWNLILLWMLGFFVYQGTQFAMPMRYFYMLYPFLALLAAYAITAPAAYIEKHRQPNWFMPILFAMLIWPMSFMTIYSRPHTYISASEWIYDNIPEGSVIVEEHWNDYLPVNLPQNDLRNAQYAQQYELQELTVFAPDTTGKINTIRDQVNQADYYIIPNNRSYGSMKTVPEEFPYMTQFYDQLFSGDLGYELVAEFTSYPTIHMGLFELPIRDQWADESFTVYDHPRVLVFKNMRK